MMNKTLTIGMFGFGCVGQGLYDIFAKTGHFKAAVKRICVKHPNKPRSVPSPLITFNKYDLLDDDAINCIVELIDDAEEAYLIVKESLLRGKDVVTANKKMLAGHLGELIEIARQKGAGLLYEGSSCGSIPIIRNLEEYYDHEPLISISGIFNGSSNFILSKIFQENVGYDEALIQAQELGFAESNPALDVGGDDAKFKLIILTAHSFGEIISSKRILNLGIQHLTTHDVSFAKEKGLKIKLVATASFRKGEKLHLSVMPAFIPHTDFLFSVEKEFNAVKIETTFADKQNFYGKGAGGHATGAAVLSDISALSYHYRYEYKKYVSAEHDDFTNDVMIEVYLRYADEELPRQLGFNEILQKFSGAGYHYVIGNVSLQNLLEHKELILLDRAFVCSTSQLQLDGRREVNSMSAEYSTTN